MKLTEILNDQLNSKRKEDDKPRALKLRPSSLGSPCLRKIFYKTTGTTPDYPTDPQSLRRMMLGDALHEKLHQIFDAAGIVIKYRNPDGTQNIGKNGGIDHEFVLTSPELLIKSAHVDLVAIIEGRLWIGEYKSINSKGFAALKEPKADHQIQATIYLYLFNKMLADGQFAHIEELRGFEKAEGILYFYVNKDNSDIKEFEITDAEATFQQVVEKVITIREHYEQDKLPFTTWDFCKTCEFRDKCKKNQLF